MEVSATLLQFLLVFIYAKIKDVLGEEVCGHPHGMVATGKIVGGYDIGYYKYPWFVSMTQGNRPICGATLINKKTVVSAAHCFDQHSDDPLELANLYVLKVGAYNICDTSETTQKSYNVQKVYIHERYKKEDPFFDISLLILKEPAEGFEPVCLPTRALDTRSRPREGYVTGFGVLKFQGRDTSCVQREARVRIYPDKVCKDMISTVDKDIKNFQHAFCAGYLEGGVDACQGDSGGPLMILQSQSRIALLGITSFGYKCAMKDLLGVYTDVSHFIDWIKEKSNLPATLDVTPTPVTGTPPTGGSPNGGSPTGALPTEASPTEASSTEVPTTVPTAPQVTTVGTGATTEESDSDDDDDQSESKTQEGGEDSTDDDDSDDDGSDSDSDEEPIDERVKDKHLVRSKRKGVNNAYKHHKKSNHRCNADHKSKKVKRKHRFHKIKHAVRTKTFYEINKLSKDKDMHKNKDPQQKHKIRKKNKIHNKINNAISEVNAKIN